MLSCSFCYISCPNLDGNGKVITKFMSQNKFITAIPTNKVNLCTDCLSRVSKSTKCTDQVVEVERDVRSLQRIILKMMRQLKSLQSENLAELNGLVEKIRKSNNGRPGVFGQEIERAIRDGVQFQNEISPKFASPTESKEPLPSAPNINPCDDAALAVPKVEVDEIDPGNFDVEFDLLPPISPHGPMDLESESLDPLQLPKKECEPTTTQTKIAVKTKTRRKIGDGRHLTCKVCGLKFPTRLKQKEHVILLHGRDQPYKCNQCPLAFKFPYRLKRHVLSHGGTRQYKCKICGMEYIRLDHLQAHHRRAHQGIQPNNCPFCDAQFTKSKGLKLHIQRQHGTLIQSSDV